MKRSQARALNERASVAHPVSVIRLLIASCSAGMSERINVRFSRRARFVDGGSKRRESMEKDGRILVPLDGSGCGERLFREWRSWLRKEMKGYACCGLSMLTISRHR